MSGAPSADIFISYARADTPFADRMAANLQREGYSVWRDVDGINVGDNWSSAIETAIVDSKLFIVIISSSARSSNWIEREIITAQSQNKPIIPVVLDSTRLPMPIVNIQAIDFSQSEQWESLSNAVQRILGRSSRNNSPPIRINLRSAPDRTSQIMGTINSDEGLTAIGEQDDWFQVETASGLRGWIQKEIVNQTRIQVDLGALKNAPPPQQARKKAAPQSKRAPRKGGEPVDDEEEEDEEPVVQVAVQSNAPPNNIDPAGGGMPPPTPPPIPTPSFPLLGSLRGAGNDRVSDQDQLGFNNYVYAFADLIESRDTTPPLTIGIYGSWGSGKSFLLNSIVRELEKPSAERLKERKTERVVRKVRVIEFNAWEYNATEVIWAGLVRKIIDKLEGDLRLGSLERRARRVRYNFGRHWRQTRGRFFGQVLLMFLLAAALVIGRNWLTGSDIASLSELLIPIVGVGSLLTIANSLREALTSPVSQWLTALFEEGDYGRQIDYMADIREDLQFLEKRLGQAQERVLIIIDDLDRCEPNKAVEVLQAINLLLNFNHFIVILGIDARIITGAISKYYSNLLEGAGASGYEYLDKIIQIPFRIPTPNRSEIQDFLSKQMGDPKAPVSETPEERIAALKRLLDEQTDLVDTAANATPEAEPVAAPPVRTRAEAAFAYDELRAFQQIADVLRPNPRHLKRLVNVYRLVRTLADYRSASVILDNPAATIRWLVLSAQWSYTSYVMLRCYDDWCEKPAGRAAVVEACGSNDPLLWLYGKVKSGLDPKRQALLDDDPDLLEALLNLPQGRVSWDELDIIRRYTINFNPAVEGESFSANNQISLLDS